MHLPLTVAFFFLNLSGLNYKNVSLMKAVLLNLYLHGTIYWHNRNYRKAIIGFSNSPEKVANSFLAISQESLRYFVKEL